MKSKKDIARTICGLGAVLAAGIVLISLGHRNDAVSEGERLKAGILTAHQINAAFETVSVRLTQRPIKEGVRVKAGDVLLGIDPTDVSLDIRSAKAQIEQTHAQIKATEQSISLALDEAATNERTAWRQIEAAEASRKSAQASLARSKADWDRAKSLLPQGAISQADYDKAREAWTAAKESLTAAEHEVDQATVGASQEERSRLVKTGSADHMRLEKIVNARQAAENQRTTLVELRAKLEEQKTALEQLEVNNDRLRLYAPEDAKVLEVLYEPGELVSPNTPAVLLETERLYFDIYVSEAQAGKFEEGVKVPCFSPALNKTFEGTVTLLEAAPDFASLKMVRERGQSDLTLFKVRIDLQRDPGLLTGMTLEVQQ